MKKLVSIFTALSFLMSVFGVDAFSAAAEAIRSGGSLKDIEKAHSFIPSNLGRVTDSAYFENGRYTIINIQDLHCHEEVQKNISGIIKNLQKKYDISCIFVEGGYGQVNTDVFGSIEDDKLRDSVISGMLGQGRLTGTEYFMYTSKAAVPVYGLENEAVHKQNLSRLSKALNNRKQYTKKLASIKNEIDYLQEKHLSRENKKFNRMVERYKAGELKPERYYALLKKYVEKINRDNEKYNSFLYISVGRYPVFALYGDLLESAGKIDYKKASAEMKSIIGQLKDRLPYSVYNELSLKTAGFTNIEELALSLEELSQKYGVRIDEKGSFSQFVRHVKAGKSLNPAELINEERRVVEDIRVAFSGNDTEIEISFLKDFYFYLEAFLNARIISGDYDFFEAEYEKFEALYKKYAFRNDLAGLSEDIKFLKEYYNVNKNRNSIFVENMEKYLGNSGGQKIAITVTGGFHSEGLHKLFNSNKISYVTVLPSVTKETKTSEQNYDKGVLSASAFASQTIALGLASQAETAEMAQIMIDGATNYLGGAAYTRGNIDQFLKGISEAVKEDLSYDYNEYRTEIKLSNGQIILLENRGGRMVNATKADLDVVERNRGFSAGAFADAARAASGAAARGNTFIFAPNVSETVRNIMAFAAKHNFVRGDGLIFDIEMSPELGDKVAGIDTVLLTRMPDYVQKAALRYQNRKKKSDSVSEGRDFMRAFIAAYYRSELDTAVLDYFFFRPASGNESAVINDIESSATADEAAEKIYFYWNALSEEARTRADKFFFELYNAEYGRSGSALKNWRMPDPADKESERNITRNYRKYSSEGQTVRFPGVTIISPVTDAAIIQKVSGYLEAFAALQSSEGKSYIKTIPPDSIHFTLLGIVEEDRLQTVSDLKLFKNPELQAELMRALSLKRIAGDNSALGEERRQTVFRIVEKYTVGTLAAMENEGFFDDAVPQFELDGIMGLPGSSGHQGAIALHVKPKTAYDAALLMHFKERVAKELGIGTPSLTRAHLTLGYFVNPVDSPDTFTALKETIDRINSDIEEELSGPENALPLKTNVSYFENMDSFPAVKNGDKYGFNSSREQKLELPFTKRWADKLHLKGWPRAVFSGAVEYIFTVTRSPEKFVEQHYNDFTEDLKQSDIYRVRLAAAKTIKRANVIGAVLSVAAAAAMPFFGIPLALATTFAIIFIPQLALNVFFHALYNHSVPEEYRLEADIHKMRRFLYYSTNSRQQQQITINYIKEFKLGYGSSSVKVTKNEKGEICVIDKGTVYVLQRGGDEIIFKSIYKTMRVEVAIRHQEDGTIKIINVSQNKKATISMPESDIDLVQIDYPEGKYEYEMSRAKALRSMKLYTPVQYFRLLMHFKAVDINSVENLIASLDAGLLPAINAVAGNPAVSSEVKEIFGKIKQSFANGNLQAMETLLKEIAKTPGTYYEVIMLLAGYEERAVRDELDIGLGAGDQAAVNAVKTLELYGIISAEGPSVIENYIIDAANETLSGAVPSEYRFSRSGYEQSENKAIKVKEDSMPLSVTLKDGQKLYICSRTQFADIFGETQPEAVRQLSKYRTPFVIFDEQGRIIELRNKSQISIPGIAADPVAAAVDKDRYDLPDYFIVNVPETAGIPMVEISVIDSEDGIFLARESSLGMFAGVEFKIQNGKEFDEHPKYSEHKEEYEPFEESGYSLSFADSIRAAIRNGIFPEALSAEHTGIDLGFIEEALSSGDRDPLVAKFETKEVQTDQSGKEVYVDVTVEIRLLDLIGILFDKNKQISGIDKPGFFKVACLNDEERAKTLAFSAFFLNINAQGFDITNPLTLDHQFDPAKRMRLIISPPQSRIKELAASSDMRQAIIQAHIENALHFCSEQAHDGKGKYRAPFRVFSDRKYEKRRVFKNLQDHFIARIELPLKKDGDNSIYLAYSIGDDYLLIAVNQADLTDSEGSPLERVAGFLPENNEVIFYKYFCGRASAWIDAVKNLFRDIEILRHNSRYRGEHIEKFPRSIT